MKNVKVYFIALSTSALKKSCIESEGCEYLNEMRLKVIVVNVGE